MNIIKMCMIYKQCNYSILLLLYDFEFENVEINKLETWIIIGVWKLYIAISFCI